MVQLDLVNESVEQNDKPPCLPEDSINRLFLSLSFDPACDISTEKLRFL